jgi:hypothetical protein
VADVGLTGSGGSWGALCDVLCCKVQGRFIRFAASGSGVCNMEEILNDLFY